jgi:hypothetical protein
VLDAAQIWCKLKTAGISSIICLVYFWVCSKYVWSSGLAPLRAHGSIHPSLIRKFMPLAWKNKEVNKIFIFKSPPIADWSLVQTYTHVFCVWAETFSVFVLICSLLVWSAWGGNCAEAAIKSGSSGVRAELIRVFLLQSRRKEDKPRAEPLFLGVSRDSSLSCRCLAVGLGLVQT